MKEEEKKEGINSNPKNKGNPSNKPTGSKQGGDSTKKKKKKKDPKPYGDGGKAEKYNGNMKTSSNPVEWYISNDQLARDVASLPYSVLTGRILPIHQMVLDDKIRHPAFPGICKISFVTSTGRSTEGTSAINTASRSIYAWVRHQNSGHSNYEAPDLMIYIMAMMEVYAAYFEAVRVYDIAMTYKLTNRYMPIQLLTSLGVNADNIMSNLAQYRAGLNLFAAKVSSLAVPNNFTTFQRHAMLLSNVFMDSDTDRGQYYIFNRSHYRVYDPTGTTGGYLKTKPYVINTSNRTGMTYDYILSTLTEMLDPILSDEDMNIMSGDILKAYDMSSLYVVPGVDENRTVSLTYDTTVLAQIENAVCVNFHDMPYEGENNVGGTISDTVANLDISQKSGFIYHAPCVGGASFTDANQIMTIDAYYQIASLNAFVLNSHVNNPDYKFNIESTRLQNVLIKDKDVDGQYNIICGTEILTNIKYYYIFKDDGIDSDGNTRLGESNYGISTIYVDNTVQAPVKSNYLFEALCATASFDWHPFTYIISKWTTPGVTDSSTQLMVPFGDARFYSVNSVETLQSIHECVLLSQFRTKLLS